MSKTLFRSFAGGEITPELFGRVELTKFQTGLRKALNFITLPHGPAARRPGTRYVNQTKLASGARVIPFSFSADQTVVLELGDQYIRFHINGQTLLEAAKTITSIAGNTVNSTAHGFLVGQWVFISGRFFKVATQATDSFTVTGLRGEAALPNPVATQALRVYEIASPYLIDDIFDIHYAQNNDVITLVHPGYAARRLSRLGATNWTLTVESFVPSTPVPAGVGVVATVAVSTNLSPQRYVVTAVDPVDGVSESLASAVVTASNNLTLAGNYNTISWTAGPAGTRYNIFKQRGGSYGYIGQTLANSIVDDNVTPDLTKVPPEDLIELNTGAGDYPAAVTYYEQRRFLAGPLLNPQTVYATRNGTETNLTSSVPSQADDALRFRVAAQQQNLIRHLVPLSDLMALTAAGEWRIFSDNEPAITPTSLTVKPLGYAGANNVQPVVTSGSILYIQAQGSRVRELAYTGDAYRSVDLSIMAPHLFNGFRLADLAYARAPDQITWAVRDDGTMLGMTYVPEQQVYGWHQHTTDGAYGSVCVVAEGNEDALYVVVKREVDGAEVNFIERMQTRIFTRQADAYFVDAGLSYQGAPTSSLSGLWHLEGKRVQILADGAVEPEQTVEDGRITLTGSASVVHVGLPYVSDFETLPLAFEGMEAAGQGTLKNVTAVHVRYTDTSLFKIGPSFDKLSPNRSRAVSDPFDSPPALKTAETRVGIAGSWGTDGSVCVRQDEPLPLTVLAMALEVELGD